LTRHGENGSDSGTKRIATNTIARVRSTTIAFLGSGNGIGNTCNGDSGGPAFSIIDGEEVVVGVTSSGTVPCGNDGFDTRVDVFAAWLEQIAAGDLVKASGVGARQPGSSDKIAPSVAFTSHKDGQRLQPGPVTITADASDNEALATVTLIINGRVFGTRAEAPFSWSLRFVPGTKDLELVAADTSGNLTKVAIAVIVEGQLSKFGDQCSSSVQCESRLCVYSRSLGRRFCSDVCSPNNNTCPPNGSCVQTTQPGFYVCALNENGEPVPGGGTIIRPEKTPPENTPQPRPVEPTPEQPETAKPRGGCSVGGDGGAGALPVSLALLGLLAVRRRRR